MPKITMTDDCVAGGKPQKKGATLEVSDADARLLINLRKAKPAKDAAPGGKKTGKKADADDADTGTDSAADTDGE